MRTIVGLIGIVAVFGAAVLYGGTYVGAWDALEPPPPAPAAAAGDEESEPAATTTGEKKPKPPSSAPKVDPAKQEWLKQANALCERSLEDVSALPRPTTKAEVEAVLAQAVDLNAFYNDEFAALGAPPGGAVAFAKLLALFEQEERLMDEVLAAYRKNDMKRFFKANDRLIPLTLDEDDLLYELGAEDCTVDLLPELPA